jgi:4-hydroxy-tetrahydrodipicolinate reductase
MKVGVFCASGRMGRSIMDIADRYSNISFVPLYRDSDLENEISKLDVLIDFSVPDATINVLKICHKYSVAIVIGTTGIDSESQQYIEDAANDIPIFYSSNMSIGISVVQKVMKQIYNSLTSCGVDDIDIEISEVHHRHKIDSPSGTAIMLAKSAADMLEGGGEVVYARSSKRSNNEVGITSLRCGNVGGSHEVIFAYGSEIIKISHTALDRSIYADGAIRAGIWLAGKHPALYTRYSS